MIGWIGTFLLVLANFLLVTKWSKYFLAVDIVASILLTIHAVALHDWPFTVVNAFVAIMLSVKLYQGGLK